MPILSLEKEWSHILAEHDRLANMSADDSVLDALSEKLHGIFATAIQHTPTCDREAALLQHMALVDAGVSLDDDDPASTAFYAVLRFLERATVALFAASWAGAVTVVSRIEELNCHHFLA